MRIPLPLRRCAGAVAVLLAATFWHGAWAPPVASAVDPPERLIWDALDPATKVTFHSGATPSDAAGVPRDTLQGYLRKPAGAGPFPAVVLLHTANLYAFQRAWADRLAGWGYVALLVNSLDRGSQASSDQLKDVATIRTHDAFGALAYLRVQPFVDGDRVGVLGWGLAGGSAALMALHADNPRSERPRTQFSPAAEMRFRVGAAYYPRCPFALHGLYAPGLILIGEKDGFRRVARCGEVAVESQGQGAKVSIKVYPGATHLFDAGKDGESAYNKPYRFDRVATEDSIARIRALLSERLR